MKTQTHQLLDALCLKVLALPGVTKKMYQEGMKKLLS